jgi:hypothetical protein
MACAREVLRCIALIAAIIEIELYQRVGRMATIWLYLQCQAISSITS